MIQEIFKFWELVRLILKVLRYVRWYLALSGVLYVPISVHIAWSKLSGNHRHHAVEIWLSLPLKQHSVEVISTFLVPCDRVFSFCRLLHHGGAKSFWPSDAIWRHISGSTLVRVMACFLMAQNRYLIQCWIINGVLWHSPKCESTKGAHGFVVKSLIQVAPNNKILMFFVSSCSWLCAIY